MNNTCDQLHQNCRLILEQLESRSDTAASDLLDNALSVEFTVDAKHQYLGARVLVAFGGPTIWVDTRRDVIDGYWGGDTVSMSFHDVCGLHERCEGLFDPRL